MKTSCLRLDVTAAMAASLIGIAPAFAVEGGVSPWLKGASGFFAGMLPPEPGIYVSNSYYYYDGSVDARVRNGITEVGVKSTLNAYFLQGTYVSDWKLFGGTYAAGALVGYAWIDVNGTIAGPLGGANVSLGEEGIADSLVTPIILGWHSEYFHWMAGLNVFVPTGPYNSRSLSTGRNIWALMPQIAGTYFDKESGWDISGALTYVTQSNNDATDYQSGDLLHLDWAIGNHFGAQKEWAVGIAGNVVQQISGDSGSGAKLGSLKAQSFGIGPALSYNTTIGSTPLSLAARWEHDLHAEKTFKGDIATVMATLVF